ncbi:2'-deoxycytidine 5'-triphosphate deaminase domain-containing protein [Prosthecobacter sp.]|uniref:2'-deoxycytidine 5'-triphosphate deaminase domain-containing protein n=1 Tax=Prosthecobacter sp. TaxID=1965333 RepID=UPI0037831FC8
MNDVKEWLPGALCSKQLEYLFDQEVIKGERPSEFGESSFDLTISDSKAYMLPKGGVKPAGDGYGVLTTKLKDFFVTLKPDENGEFLLKKGTTYLFGIGQRLHVDNIREHRFFGQATAKSSIGRMDVLVRLIVDGMDCYEGFIPDRISSGDMYVEISPLSFDVVVKRGIAITQLRLFYGSPDECEITGDELHRATLIGSRTDGYLRVDLSNIKVKDYSACAFKAAPQEGVIPVRLWSQKPKIEPHKYWECIASKKVNGTPYLPIEKERFYILRSKERLALHDSLAVYCLAIDESIGEMRIHYAGFVHPLFGREREDDQKGTPLIFEVRGHDVPVVLHDGEKLAKLKYYRMSDRFERSVSEIKGRVDGYKDQTLKLSAFFGDW